jgi:hypothetical protein
MVDVPCVTRTIPFVPALEFTSRSMPKRVRFVVEAYVLDAVSIEVRPSLKTVRSVVEALFTTFIALSEADVDDAHTVR